MNTATIVTNGTVANSKFCTCRPIGSNVETRIHAHQEHIDCLIWTVEWRKNSRSKWNKYCKCDTVAEAEKYREICRDLKGQYPVLHTDRKGLTRFRVVEDYGYFQEGFVKVEYSTGLGKWYSYGNYVDLDVAKEIISKVKADIRSLPNHGIRKAVWNVRRSVESTVLCIRFPFLYPRNRFSGKHYTDWTLDEKIKDIHKEAYECTNPVEFHKGLTEEELHDIQHPKYRVRNLGKALECSALKVWRFLKTVAHAVPTSTELDAMDNGWRKAFGISICKEIKTALKKYGYLRKYRITQIKEKWGELCWYDAGAPQEVFDIIRKYEGISRMTCIECGKPAKYRSTGWVEPYCEDCLPEKIRESGRYCVATEDGGWEEIDPDNLDEKSL